MCQRLCLRSLLRLVRLLRPLGARAHRRLRVPRLVPPRRLDLRRAHLPRLQRLRVRQRVHQRRLQQNRPNPNPKRASNTVAIYPQGS